MLKELRSVRQIPDEGFRRWFRDAGFDLIVFYPSQNEEEISGFQLCYHPVGDVDERVFSWHKAGGYTHNRVDDGETEPLHSKMSPVLAADGVFDSQTVLGKFMCAAADLEPRILREVKMRIEDFQS
jgi:hypothetical protein